MIDTSANRFAEYTTSGAFNISLTRRQVAALSMFADRDEWQATGYEALERKGLINVLPREGHRPPSAKITAAGLLTAQLCAMAGLTNSPAPDASQEIDALHQEIASLRAANAELVEDSHSLCARMQAMEIELCELRAEKRGGRFPKPMVTLKDRQPEKCPTAMLFMKEVRP